MSSNRSEDASGPVSRSEIEAGLDTVAEYLVSLTRDQIPIPGWHLLPLYKIGRLEVDGLQPFAISEASAANLVSRAETDPHAFDLASYIVGYHIACWPKVDGDALSPSLRLFGARALVGEAKRPPQPGRKHAPETLLRAWQYALCRFVQTCASLQLTRSRERKGTHSFTACDAVADAFTRAGKHTTYGQLASYCTAKNYAHIRELAEYHRMLDFEADE